MFDFLPVFMAGAFLGDNPFMTLLIVALALVVVMFVIMLATRFRRCPSNKILVIFGRVGSGQSSKCLQGGGAFVWPLIQNYDFLDLEPMQIDIPLEGALSAENIRVNVPSVFTVAVGTQPEIMTNAAVRLLGLQRKEIAHQARDIIFGQLRQVIASMAIESINRDRDIFLHSIQESLEPELAKIGLVLINVNITDITDESGYIEALGRKAASEAIQKAEVDVAEQRKFGSIGVARADREKEIEVAVASKEQEIGTKEAERDRMIRVADLEREKTIGEKQAEFEREAAVQDADREKRIRVAAANAAAVAGENDAKAQIADVNADLAVKEAEAFATSETSRRQAEAAVLEAQYIAEAQAAAANAKKIEAEQRAALEAPARAEKARLEVDASAEAEKAKIEADGEATALVRMAEGEAKAIFARLEAEARGEYEKLAKKADGLKQIVSACGGAQEAFQLLMLEHLDHLAEQSAKAISEIKFDKVTVWDGGSGNGSGDGGRGGVAGFLGSLGGAVPPLLDVMKNIGGVEMPSFLGTLVDESAKSDDGDGAVPVVIGPPPATDDTSKETAGGTAKDGESKATKPVTDGGAGRAPSKSGRKSSKRSDRRGPPRRES